MSLTSYDLQRYCERGRHVVDARRRIKASNPFTSQRGKVHILVLASDNVTLPNAKLHCTRQETALGLHFFTLPNVVHSVIITIASHNKPLFACIFPSEAVQVGENLGAKTFASGMCMI